MNRREKLTIELREYIGEAILDLMKEKPLDKITVDEIAKKADVGRVTFYRQFSSKQEAISYKLHRDWLKFEKEQDVTFETAAPLTYAKVFFKFIYSIRDTNTNIIKNDCKYCIFNAMRYSFENINDSENTQEYYHDHFRAYGLLGLVEGWIDAEYDLSIDEISSLAVKYFYKV